MDQATTIEPAAEPAAIPAPTGGLSLRKNFSWTFVGNVVYAACQWGILVVLAKLGTPEMVGQFALGLAITAPILMFSQLQLRAVQATDAKREYQFGDYLALRLITTALALAVIGGIVAAGGYRRETALVILIVGAMKGIDALSDVYYGLWQQHERMDGIAQALMLNGVVSTAALAALMWTTRSVVIAVLGSATGSLAAYLFTLARNKRLALAKSRRTGSGCQVLVLFRLSVVVAPLGFASLLNSLGSNIPRYFLEAHVGVSELGIFAAMASLMVAGTTIVTALGQTTLPRLATLYAIDQLSAMRILLLRMISLAGLIGLIGVAVAATLGKSILNLVYRPEYAQHIDVFVLISISALFTYIGFMLNYGLAAVRKFNAHCRVTLGVVIVTAIASAVLIPGYGLHGAALSVLVGVIFQVASSGFIVYRTITLDGITR